MTATAVNLAQQDPLANQMRAWGDDFRRAKALVADLERVLKRLDENGKHAQRSRRRSSSTASARSGTQPQPPAATSTPTTSSTASRERRTEHQHPHTTPTHRPPTRRTRTRSRRRRSSIHGIHPRQPHPTSRPRGPVIAPHIDPPENMHPYECNGPGPVHALRPPVRRGHTHERTRPRNMRALRPRVRRAAQPAPEAVTVTNGVTAFDPLAHHRNRTLEAEQRADSVEL